MVLKKTILELIINKITIIITYLFKRLNKYVIIRQTLNILQKLHGFTPYFSVQLLFVWLVFKMSFFLKLELKFRLILAFIFLSLLIFFWHYILPIILNSFFFQFYLCLFYFLINSFFPQFLSFGLSFILSVCYLKEVKINIYHFSCYLPNLECFLCILVCFDFFRRFNNNIIIPEIKKGVLLEFLEKEYIEWPTIVWLINRHFKNEFHLTNKLFFINNKNFLEYFPINKKFVLMLRSCKTEEKNLLIILLNETLKEKSNDISIDMLSQKFAEEFIKKNKINEDNYNKIAEEAAIASFDLNKSFFFHILQGLLLSFILILLFLNFY